MKVKRVLGVLFILTCIITVRVTGVVPDKEVLIKFRPTATAELQEEFINEIGLTEMKRIDEISVRKYKITSDYSVSEVLKLCSNTAFVEYAEPTQAVRASAVTESFNEPGNEEPVAVQAEPAEFKPGEVLIKFKKEADQARALQALGTASIEVTSRLEGISVLQCTVLGNKSVLRAIEECNANPDIEYAEPNYIYRASVEPNDPRFSSLYGMRQIDAPEAWDVQTGSKAIIVGVIDTGVDMGHSDLKANMWRNPGETGDGKENNGVDDDGNGFVDDYRGWDFVGNDNNPHDDNRHGTHVSGTIGAVGNNSKGVVGVNWNTAIMPLRFLDAQGSGTTDDAVEAIIYGANMGAKVLSNSWGGGGRSQALEDAIKYANSRGVVFVAAAGNESGNNDRAPSYPANYNVENVISVASNTSSENLSGFSNFGKTTVDLSAPGSGILSTVPRGGYESLDGTSMATPHVSGAAALVWAQYPNASMNDVMIRLLGSVDRRASYANKVATGGRLNVNRALSTNPIIASTTRLGNTLDETGPYVVESDILDDSGIQGATLTYQVTGQPAATVNMVAQAAHRFRGEIPGQTLGSTVVYFVSATDDAGNRTQDNNFTFSIAEPSNDDGCCGQPAIDFEIASQPLRTSVNAAANASFFMIPLLALGLMSRRRKK